MSKKWHKGGCGAEAIPAKCYKCGGNGHRMGNVNDPRDCAYCNGHGNLCGKCNGAFS